MEINLFLFSNSHSLLCALKWWLVLNSFSRISLVKSILARALWATSCCLFSQQYFLRSRGTEQIQVDKTHRSPSAHGLPPLHSAMCCPCVIATSEKETWQTHTLDQRPETWLGLAILGELVLTVVRICQTVDDTVIANCSLRWNHRNIDSSLLHQDHSRATVYWWASYRGSGLNSATPLTSQLMMHHLMFWRLVQCIMTVHKCPIDYLLTITNYPKGRISSRVGNYHT